MKRWGVALVAAGLLLIIYRLTLSPSLTWSHYGADSGDLVTAVARGSIPHPPGFPTYLLLGELFIRLPWGEPAWRLNLMSAVMAAGAGALTVAAVQEAGSKKQEESAISHSLPAICDLRFAICAGLCLGLAPLFWSQALIAEVYAPAAFFAALVVVLVLRGGPAWAVGLVWGVGMGAHPTLVLLAPIVALCTARNGIRGYGTLLAMAFLGWGAVYGPVLVARGRVSSPWADVTTLAGWWALVSGRLYHGYLFGLPLAAYPQRLLAWAGLMARQFTPVGALLAGLGWLHLWREQRFLAAASALSFGAFSLYAIGYNTADSLVYLVPALPLAALWLGRGLAQVAGWLSAYPKNRRCGLQPTQAKACTAPEGQVPSRRLRWGVWAFLLLPLLQALLFWGQTDLSGDRAAMEWAERVLQQAPPQAVLLTAQDAQTFTLWYAHDVLGERPDAVVVDRDLWGYEPYRKMMAGVLGFEVADSLSPEEAARRLGRPVVEVTND